MRILFFEGLGGRDSICGVEIIKNEDKTVVVLTEADENPGTSVTNGIEKIARKLCDTWLEGTDPKSITWIEHYPKSECKYSLVTLNDKLLYPKWQHLTQDQFDKIADEGPEEEGVKI